MSRVILIDGRAGSGKTTLATHLAERSGAQLVHMDDLTPGWLGLHLASAHLMQLVTTGKAPRYDWVTGRSDGFVQVELDAPLIVEGCGSITRQTAPLAQSSLWLDCDDSLRAVRALGRDGDSFATHWDEWAAQEQAHIDAERPHDLAHLVCRGDDTARAHDKLAECSKLLFSSLVPEATSEHFSKQ